MTVRIGIQTAFTARPLTSPFDFAVKHGFDAFEWFPDWRSDGTGWVAGDLSQTDRINLRNRARDAGIRLSIHAPLVVDLFRPETNGELEDTLHLAVDLGADLINLHFNQLDRVDDFARSVVPLLDRCSAAGIRLALENLPAAAPDDFNRLFALLPRAGVGMCLDVGHANLFPGTRGNYLAYVDQLDPVVPIIHVHLHENDGRSDSHQVVLADGSEAGTRRIAGLFDRLARRKFDGRVILQQWPDPPERLVEARDRLRQVLDRKSVKT
ncbi:MAG: sugar phosphate isomerase/epimerase family protein [Gemmataceae bacterium]